MWNRAITRRISPFFLLFTAACFIGFASPPVSTPLPPALATDSPKITPLRSSLTFPFRNWHGLPVVMGRLGSLEHLSPLVIATTLDACTITPQAVKEAGLSTMKNRVTLHLPDQSDTGPLLNIPHLQIGAITLTNLAAVESNTMALLSAFQATRPDAPMGWLGAPFLVNYQIGFYGSQNVLVLEPSSDPLPHGKGIVITPMEKGNSEPQVKVDIPGAAPFLALLDTTFPLTIIPAEAALKAKLKVTRMMPVHTAAGQVGFLAMGQVPRISIGKASAQSLTVAWIPPSPGGKTVNQPAPRLGRNFLDRFQITISYAKRKVAFQPNPPAERKHKSESNK